MTEVKGMLYLSCIPEPPSNKYFLVPFSLHSLSPYLHFQALCLFVFLSNLHLSFTVLWPCLSDSDLLHLYTRLQVQKTMHVKGESQRGGLCITLHPVSHWRTLLSCAYHPLDLHEPLQLKSSAAWKHSAVGSVWKTTHALLCPGQRVNGTVGSWDFIKKNSSFITR